ncbi:MAG: HAD hydrolase-like protein [Bacteroidales bacterium]|nr:HAD hydrolase-like protein [Bacteroidales bacterium]
MDYRTKLKNLQPGKDFFVGIDSDGCVFDTMEVKQKEFFIPAGIKYFDLFAISGLVRETWEFVNLYSVHRGVNRFPALLKVFELLGQREEIKNLDYKLPDLTALKEWISQENILGNQSLRTYYKQNPEPGLKKVLDWSESINTEIAGWLKGVLPFDHARSSLEKIREQCDSIVVSQTPLEALEREWKQNKLDKLVRMIAGQEYGTKTEHIALAAKNKYPDNRILMIGDAPGDLKAARDNNICFYPVIPGKEAGSWDKFYNEALEKFIRSEYRGKYENALLEEFSWALPVDPPWSRKTKK